MSSTKLQFHLAVDGDGKTNKLMVKGVRIFDAEEWYLFPEDLQKHSEHANLMQLPIAKIAISALKTRGHYRTINVTLSDDLLEEYLDEDSNFIFKNVLLPEGRLSTQLSKAQTSSDTSEEKTNDLVSCLSKIVEQKEEPVKEILKHFLIEKFVAKNRNVIAWCELFEKESKRFSLSGRKQIEVFKSCLDPSLNDWFAVHQRRFPDTAVWKDWKEKLVSTFGDNSWSPIRYAFNFKHLSGSYIEYAVKKEKMLLELDREISDLMILDLIVIGLPAHIQNSLNRFSIKNIDLLHNKLKKFEADDRVLDNVNKTKKFKATNNGRNFNSTNKQNSTYSSGIFENSQAGNKSNVNVNLAEKEKNNGVLKKPCSICASKGYSDRYHPENTCWFKDKGPTVKKESNKIEVEPSSSGNFFDEEAKN